VQDTVAVVTDDLFAELKVLDEQTARAAGELGVPVPKGFQLLGVDDDGRYLARNDGTAEDHRRGGAILSRLGGMSVEEALAKMNRPYDGPRPAWWGPEDLHDQDALLAYLAERDKHPEWPRPYNGPADWAMVLGGGAGIAAIATSIARMHGQQVRANLARFVVKTAVEQGVQIDPAELLRAINAAVAEQAAPERAVGDQPTEVGKVEPPDERQ